MRYARSFHIQAAHFNSEKAYEVVWAVAEQIAQPRADILFAFADCHGHNFKIDVVVIGELDNPWLIDDVQLTKVVMGWDNTNLSMHPDFIATKDRATTENMAYVLFRKLTAIMPPGVWVELVRINETQDIYAEARNDLSA